MNSRISIRILSHRFDMTRGFDVPKVIPADGNRQPFDAIEANADEVFFNEPSRQDHQGLSSSIYLKDLITRLNAEGSAGPAKTHYSKANS